MYTRNLMHSVKRLAIAGILLSVSTIANAGWFDDLLKSLGGSEKTAQTVQTVTQAVLSDEDITQAFRQALELGSDAVVSQVSQFDGFNTDPAIHIPLPNELKQARDLLGKVGMEKTLDDLEVRLNRAAESAAPQAKQLFMNAITGLTFSDIREIYEGNDDAATRYFQSSMTPELTSAMLPVIDKSLSEVGALQRYDDMISAYKTLPFVPDIKADLTNHVVKGSLDGIFHYLAEQEAAIRKDPIKQTTALLERVFGQSSE